MAAEPTAAVPAARPSCAPSELEARLDRAGTTAGAQLRRSGSVQTTMEPMQHLAGAGSPSVEQRRGGGANTGELVTAARSRSGGGDGRC